jgi:DNA-binding SARP family transcriptional activator
VASGYVLDVGDEAVDAARFAALAAQARATPDPAAKAALLADALALWRGPAFADFRDEEFARAATARLDEQRLTVVEELAEARLALGEHALLADELGDPPWSLTAVQRRRGVQYGSKVRQSAGD